MRTMSTAGGSARVVDNRGSIVPTRTYDGGYGARVVDRIHAVEKRDHCGMEWTGAGFPLRIPTTWKVQAQKLSRRIQHGISLVSPRDVMAALAVGLFLTFVWLLLG
jgi:hypothetical protein